MGADDSDDEPIAYTALTPGVPVLGPDGSEVGRVERVLDIPDQDIFRGLVIRTPDGVRLLERDQIGGITRSAVRCLVGAGEVARLPRPDRPTTIVRPNPQATGNQWVVVVRCRRGALFQTLWIPMFSIKAIRLGRRRVQRCPVHGRWELVERVDPADLTAEDRAAAARYPADPIP